MSSIPRSVADILLPARISRGLMTIGLVLALVPGCSSSNPGSARPPAVSTNPSQGEKSVWFIDATEQVGLTFKHDSGGAGELLLPEIVGSGAALLDVDQDDDLDLFFVVAGPLTPPANATDRPNHRVFRNDLDVKSGRGLRFTEITESCAIRSAGYGMGVASGDFDGDGLLDLYVCNLGSNQLLRNLGQGRFEDVTQQAGVDDPRWSSSATFFDYDRDGKLDLFVTNYVAFDREKSPKCFAPSSARDYCGPDAYTAVHDSLFHNLGNGRFENITATSGLLESFGAGLGVVAADLNNDGWCDQYVANDGDPNQLWFNQQGTGRFVDDGLLAGVALSLQGQAQAGMGVDAADLDDDGDEDLFVTNLAAESDTLYVNQGAGIFEDRTMVLGLHAPSLPFTSFGTRFLDFDHDGDLDLFAMNGAVRLQDTLVAAGDSNPLRQTNQLFRNDGAQGFKDISRESGPAFEFSGVSRAACIGDLDNDGDLDIVQTTNNGPARVLLSQAAGQTRWLGLKLIDPRFGSDILQTRVKISMTDRGPAWRRTHTDGSYQSAGDPRLIVGLGNQTAPRTVTACWPDGLVEEFVDLKADQYHVLERGKGRRIDQGQPN